MYTGNNTIKNWAEEDRPREKLLLKGRGVLTDAELLAIIIRSGTKELTALDLAKQILETCNQSISEMARLSISELTKFTGIGEAKAISIIAALELGKRKHLNRAGTRTRIGSSQDAFACVHALMADLIHEEFKVLLLNRNNRLLRVETISVGGVSGTVVDAKIIFKRALERNASSVILVHNHPSGNLTPSEADLKITSKLVEAGKNLDINVLDHLIVSDRGYYSFADEGKI